MGSERVDSPAASGKVELAWRRSMPAGRGEVSQAELEAKREIETAIVVYFILKVCVLFEMNGLRHGLSAKMKKRIEDERRTFD